MDAHHAEALPDGTKVRKTNWTAGYYIFFDEEQEGWISSDGRVVDAPTDRPGAGSITAWEVFNEKVFNEKKQATKGKTMISKKKATVKEDMRKAMVRTGVTVATTSMTSAIVATLKRSKAPTAQVKAAAAFLATPSGEATVRLLLGHVLAMAPAIPQMPENFPLDDISEELRVSGMAIIGLSLATMVQAALVPAFAELMPMLQHVTVPKERA